MLYQLWEAPVLDYGYVSFSKNQVFGNSETQGRGLPSGILLLFLFLSACVHAQSDYVGVGLRSFCEMVHRRLQL